MKHGKTLRMTSILLALMMFFGMFAVLLVPSGVAGAEEDGAVVDIIITDENSGDDGAHLDTLNTVSRDYDSKAIIEISKYFRNDSLTYEDLLITVIDPNGKRISAHEYKQMRQEGDYFYYDFPISSSLVTGMYKVELVRAWTDSNGQEAREFYPITVAAFWLYEMATVTTEYAVNANKIEDAETVAADKNTKTTVNQAAADYPGTKNYNGPEAEIKMTGLVIDAIFKLGDLNALRAIDPYTKKIDSAYDLESGKEGGVIADYTVLGWAAGSEPEFSIPKNAVHGRKLRYGFIVISETSETSPGFCKFVPTADPATNNVVGEPDRNVVYVDSKGPVLKASEITISFGTDANTPYYHTVGKPLSEIKDGYEFFTKMPNLATPEDPTTDTLANVRFQVTGSKSITDADSGIHLALAAAQTDTLKGLNALLWQPGKGAATPLDALTKADNTADPLDTTINTAVMEAVCVSPIAGLTAGFATWEAGGAYKFVFRATDRVGNKAELQTGLIEVVERYNPIMELDAVINEYTLTIGDVIEFPTLQEWTKAVLYGADKTKSVSNPEAWTLVDASVAGAPNPLREYFDIEYDEDNLQIVKMTAKKVGFTTIELTPTDVHLALTTAHSDTLPGHEYDDAADAYETELEPSSNRLYFTILEKDANPVSKVTVTPKTLELSVGGTGSLTAVVAPSNASDKTVNWVSSNPAIATVDENGVVTAVGNGVCWIYARSNMHSGIQDDCKVYVGANDLKGISLNKTATTLNVGEGEKLTVYFDPATAEKPVTWTSSDPTVATVSADGTVTGLKAGTVTITATAGGKTATCTVTVQEPGQGSVGDGWQEINGEKYYYVNGNPVTSWRYINGKWYYFRPNSGEMMKNGWLKEGGNWYYLNPDGTMKSAEWHMYKGKWCWQKANGASAIGWEKINGTWYYFDASTYMKTGWVNVRGIWYYMEANGKMAEGWKEVNGVWYYLTPGGGAMVTGKVSIGGVLHNFAASGAWLGRA